MKPRARLLRLESLEARSAPATLATSNTLTFRDVDGDSVIVAFNKPVLTDVNANTVFTFNLGSVNGDNSVGQQLRAIDLTAFGDGLSVTVTARAANGGDGLVNVGWINASGKDLAAVTVAGDLGRVSAGDANAKTTGLGSLMVGSLGTKGLTTQALGGSLVTDIVGRLGKITVADDVAAARARATGGTPGDIGPVTIGGSLVAHATDPATGLIEASDSIGPIKIGGDIKGGGGANSGIRAGTNIRPVTIGGSVLGGAG